MLLKQYRNDLETMLRTNLLLAILLACISTTTQAQDAKTGAQKQRIASYLETYTPGLEQKTTNGVSG